MPARRCAECGAENDADAVFCESCHQFLSWQQPAGDPDPVVAPPRSVVATAPVESVPQPEPPPTAVTAATDAIHRGREVADSRGREDLKDHLDQAEQRLADQLFPVAVIGEFKRGKSTLVNALLQYDVCPVDADIVTAVPTTVTYADEPYVTSFVRTEDGDRSYERPAGLDELRTLVTEGADPDNPEQMRAVEVGLPHRMLRTGLSLIDTPGVGGLDSAHGFLTLGALRLSTGALFVSDASQELTEPELGFLATAVNRCPATALVITKIDLYPRWRDIVELNREHLVRAKITIPILPVSSLLRLLALDQEGHEAAALDAESGFADLVTFLAEDVVRRGRDRAATVAAHEVEFVAAQVAQEAAVERVIIAEPERAAEVVAEIQEVEERTRKLAAPGASWQQTLGDGITDIIADVEHDLQRRLRTVIKDAEELIEASDPNETWAATEAWLRRRIAILVTGNRDELVARSEQLAEAVAADFDLQAGEPFSLYVDDGASDASSGVALAGVETFAMPGGKVAPLMSAARSSYYLPMMIGNIVGGMIPGGGALVHLAVLGASALLGTGIGSKIIRDERTRQRTFRQQQAKAAVRRFVDEVAFSVNKETRDQLRSAQRQLRDDFHGRATQLHRSAIESAERARAVAALDGPGQQRRRRELGEERRQLEGLRTTTRELVSAA